MLERRNGEKSKLVLIATSSLSNIDTRSAKEPALPDHTGPSDLATGAVDLVIAETDVKTQIEVAT